MSKILVLAEDGLLQIRLRRILTDKGHSAEITNKPTRVDDMRFFDVLIVHSSYRITNLAGFIENLVLKDAIPVIFLSMNPQSGFLPKLNRYPGFAAIDEMKMEAELPISISLFEKFRKQTGALKQENLDLRSKAENERIFRECKEYLISTGLSEAEAHRQIQKAAMDSKTNKYVTAARILREKPGNS